MTTAEILKIVGQIAGIGGLAIGALILIFRDVISKKIFPELPPAKAYQLLRLVLILTWSVALAGITAWVLVQRAGAIQNENSLSDLHRAEKQPVFRTKLQNHDGRAEIVKSILLIHNDGGPITNINLDIAEMLTVAAEVYDENGDEVKKTIELPVIGYWAGRRQKSATTGLIFELSHEAEASSTRRLTYWLRDIATEKAPNYQGADVFIDVVLMISFHDIFRQAGVQYLRVSEEGFAESLPREEGERFFSNYRAKSSIDYRDIDRNQLSQLWDDNFHAS